MSTWDMVRPYLEPIWPLLEDPLVSEIFINKGGQFVYAERHGFDGARMEPAKLSWDNQLRPALVRLAREQGSDIHEHTHPILDAVLPDGSRLACIAGPSSPHGATVTIRKFLELDLTLDDMVDQGMMDGSLRTALVDAVGNRKNILVSGGTGSGKTTMTNALMKHIPPGQRLGIIEDTEEIKIEAARHAVRLKTVPEINGQPAVTAKMLLKALLRHKPDRIILGEVRGEEAWELLNLLNTGHPGGVCTLHADSAEQSLSRFEVCCLMARMDLPHVAIQMQIGDFIDLVVHISVHADADGRKRRTAAAVRVNGYDVQERRYRFLRFP